MSKNLEKPTKMSKKTLKNIKIKRITNHFQKPGKILKNVEKAVKNIEKSTKMSKNVEKTVKNVKKP